ncbi:protein kinase domain protein [Ichthyophthirius multifiliis]|uniref:non-specific serine/threonine protein kinase n=1 Tax=Ichthyophthirius multifiliis TaxID=5932 RepID=G0QJ87_ICHMU|nr:protein kinase domain protein [Ichthyophthirius multifiliis]EGR34716.1 protein kinase domain protein [Ichthyophthirius multifiliis]|eukprot:XP_004040020.1 protein kinase domain protein [Ichthyophthirius multifiliis]
MQGGCIAVYLMELCDGGSLFDLISQNQQTRLQEKKLIHIINEAAKGIKALHQMNPPIVHRDIKIENILLGHGKYKLCDFGSCSSQIVDFSTIPQHQYDNYEDLFSKTTTLMYRPPEMCEPSRQYLVNQKVDIWMLGCVLYTIAFYTHPFVESQKMAIIDATFRFPQNSKYSEKLHDLIRHMLTPDPKYRPDINNIIQICENYDNMSQINLNQMAAQMKTKQIQIEKQLQTFSSKPIKQFDGDIPMEELLKIQENIKKECLGSDDEQQNEFTFVRKKQPVVKKKNLNNSKYNNNNSQTSDKNHNNNKDNLIKCKYNSKIIIIAKILFLNFNSNNNQHNKILITIKIYFLNLTFKVIIQIKLKKQVMTIFLINSIFNLKITKNNLIFKIIIINNQILLISNKSLNKIYNNSKIIKTFNQIFGSFFKIITNLILKTITKNNNNNSRLNNKITFKINNNNKFSSNNNKHLIYQNSMSLNSNRLIINNNKISLIYFDNK